MKTIKLIVGNITFENGNAIVHEIDGLINCESILVAENLGEFLINDYGAYLVPESFGGTIEYECDENILTN